MKFTICFRKRSVSQSVWKSFEEISVTIFKLKNSSYNWNITFFFPFVFEGGVNFEVDDFFFQLKTLALHLWTESEICSESFRIFKIREMFEIRSEWSIEASRKTFRRENPSGTIGGETPFATYLTVPRKPTSSLITQRNLPTFRGILAKRQRRRSRGRGKNNVSFPPFQLPQRIVSFTSSLLIFFHTYIYISPFLETIFLHFYVCSPNIYRSARKKGR